MGNNFAIKPTLTEPFPDVPKIWTDPVTGLMVPKDPVANLQFRADILQKADKDRGLQLDLYTACSQSILYWINTMAFTFRVMDTDKEGRARQAKFTHLPFVTWAFQDNHILEIEKAINEGYDLLTEKSRDMGASWNILTVLHHQWLFRDDRLFLEISRVESDVDGSGNPRALFVKHDYINKWLPHWMLPNIGRTTLHLVNLDRGSRIDGESSNEAAGSSARCNAILLDEMAKMNNAEKIKMSTVDVTPCRLANSTPFGAGTAYSKWRMSGQVKVHVLPWWDHPEKGLGRYIAQQDNGKWKIRSPWYNVEEGRRSPQEMAQEIDMDHIGSGSTFFEPHIIEEHKRMFGSKKFLRLTIAFKKTVPYSDIPKMLMKRDRKGIYVRPGSRGPLRVWAKLIGGRLDQTKNYIMGIDISKGQGASNSVISIFCKETGIKVAEWADANTAPYDFALICCAIALWIGGASHGQRPLMIWESNGDTGIDFGNQIVKTFQYPYFYFDQTVGSVSDKRTKKYGWHSNPEKKALVLGEYRRVLAHGGYINPSEESMDEASMYIYYDDGGIGPAVLVEESNAARKTHGDRVIADALSKWGCAGVLGAKAKKAVAPERSPAARMKKWKRAQKSLSGVNVKIGQQIDLRGYNA